MLTYSINIEHMKNANMAHVARSGRSPTDAIICNWSGFYWKRSSIQMASKLRATWALLFWLTWSAAVDQTLLLNENGLK